MVIETASGTSYIYDMRSNKILPEEEAHLLSEARPIVFGRIEEAETLPNIDTFILELTQKDVWQLVPSVRYSVYAKPASPTITMMTSG